MGRRVFLSSRHMHSMPVPQTGGKACRKDTRVSFCISQKSDLNAEAMCVVHSDHKRGPHLPSLPSFLSTPHPASLSFASLLQLCLLFIYKNYIPPSSMMRVSSSGVSTVDLPRLKPTYHAPKPHSEKLGLIKSICPIPNP